MNDQVRIGLFANNRLGLETARFLADDVRTRVELLVLNTIHPVLDVAIQESFSPDTVVWRADQLVESGALRKLADMNLDFGVSAAFGHILTGAVLNSFSRGVVNLHPSFLPYNRGAHPAAWSIWEGTPNGVTIHLMDSGVDTGPILAQRLVKLDDWETAGDAYLRNETEMIDLFCESYPSWLANEVIPLSQSGVATSHRVADLDRLIEVGDVKHITGEDLLRRMRATSFVQGGGVRLEDSAGRRYRARVEMELEVVDE